MLYKNFTRPNITMIYPTFIYGLTYAAGVIKRSDGLAIHAVYYISIFYLSMRNAAEDP